MSAADLARRRERVGLVFAAMCAVSGGFVPAVAKLTTAGADSTFVATTAALIAGVCATLVLGGRGELALLVGRTTGPRLALIGALGTALAYTLFFAGTAYAVVTLSRFAAGEMVPAERRAGSISIVVLGGTLGAVFGPLLVAPLGRWAASTLGSELTGPYVGGALLLGLSALVVFVGLRPDPGHIADRSGMGDESTGASRVNLAQVFARPGVRLGTLTMVVGQLVMVMLMVITSLHMRNHGHGLGGIAP